MAPSCFSGCAKQYQGLKGFLKPLTHGADAWKVHEIEAAAVTAEEQSLASEPHLPVLLGARAPISVEEPKGVEAARTELGAGADRPAALSALTTAAEELAASPACSTPVRWNHGCCEVQAWDSELASAKLGEAAEAAWHGGVQVATFMTRHFQDAADFATPHVVSWANHALETWKTTASRPALKPTGSTWEANSRQQSAMQLRAAAPPPLNISDYDVVDTSSGAPTPFRTSSPAEFERMRFNAGSRPAAGPPAGSYDVARDAQLRYALDASRFQEAPSFITVVPHAQSFTVPPSPALSTASALPPLPGREGRHSFSGVSARHSFAVLQPPQLPFDTGAASAWASSANAASAAPVEATVLRTSLGERRPFDASHPRPLVRAT
ncbi:unnamed protein product [Durusdinium trenchii]|uniref:Uncharacterized protein n=1 Tax=Durusdinium trenchii TaxID=1381693 RepID=A0ABP0S667_9DINO